MSALAFPIAVFVVCVALFIYAIVKLPDLATLRGQKPVEKLREVRISDYEVVRDNGPDYAWYLFTRGIRRSDVRERWYDSRTGETVFLVVDREQTA